MLTRGLSLGLSLVIVSMAQAGAVVKLQLCTETAAGQRCQAQPAGPPFAPGSTVLIDVALSQTPGGSDHELRMIQFDINAAGNAPLTIDLPVQHNLDGTTLPTPQDIQFWSFLNTTLPCTSPDLLVCGRGHFIVDQLGLPTPISPGDGIFSITYVGKTDPPEDFSENPNDQLTLPGDGTDLHVGTLAVTLPNAAPLPSYVVDILNASETDVDKGAQVRFGFGGPGDPITAWRASGASPDLTDGQIILDVGAAMVDLSLTKVVTSSPTLNEGDTAQFSISVNNIMGTATGVVVQDRLPAGLTLITPVVPPAGTTFDPATGNWTVGTLGTGVGVQLNLSATVDAGTAGSTLTNVAEVIDANETDVDSTVNNDVLSEDDQDDASVDVRVPVEVTSWASLGPHGALGEVALAMDPTGIGAPLFIEPRISGLNKIEVGFSGPIDPAGASMDITGCFPDGTAVDLSTTTITPTVAGDGLSMTVTISPPLPGNDPGAATGPARYTLRVNANGAGGGAAVTVNRERVAVAMLADVDGDLVVGNGDVGLVRFVRDSPPPAGDPNFFFFIRSDVDNDGVVGNADVGGTRFIRDAGAPFTDGSALSNPCP